ncbi:MAG: O-antigen ligase family protein [Chitinophagaceae bacterium]
MEPVRIPIRSEKKKAGLSFRKRFPGPQLNNPLGILLFLSAAVLFAITVAELGVSGGMLALVVIIALPMLYAIMVYMQFGVWLLLIFAYLLFFLMRLGVGFPLGTLIDGLQVLLFIGFFIHQRTKPNWKDLKTPVSVMVLVWIGYNVLAVVNPEAPSRMAWVYTIRSVAIITLSYFVFLYSIRTVTFVRIILKTWIALSLFAAFYAFKQEYIGFTSGENAWLASDPKIAALLFIDGAWRKFSIMADPVAFSYNMAISSILCIGLMTGPMPAWKKVVLGFCTVLFLFAMLLSGTRSAYLMVPVGLIFLAILKFNRKVLRVMVVVGVVMIVLVFMPTTNYTLYRFQTAFRPSQDASFNVRKANQEKIQPYILTHPIGGGLGATGAWGQRFAPDSYLANFPPDSGYVRVAVELGWIGLLLFCILLFLILKMSINNYYAIRDPELKTYCLAMTLILYAFTIGNYPQEALVQYPSNIYFYLVVALVSITYQLDRKKQAASEDEKKILQDR